MDQYYHEYQYRYLGMNGDSVGWDFRLELPAAWAIHSGDTSVRIGILDWGIDPTHRDMDEKDILHGGPRIGHHGTAVASVAFAATNDWEPGPGDGLMAGINWWAKGASYRTYDGNITDRILDAFFDGCGYINCSFEELNGYSAIFHETVTSVKNAGVVVVAAATNNNAYGTYFPAAYEQVIAVGAIDEYGQRSIWPNNKGSSWGPWLDFVAPGTAIRVATPDTNNGYATLNGTSFSAPTVTAIVSLIYGYGITQGYDLADHDDIYNLLRLSADSLVYSAWYEQIGWGMPKLDSAYWFLTKPNTLSRYDVQGGWEESTTYGYRGLTGVNGLPSGLYLVRQHILERWVQYPDEYHVVHGVWVRGSSSQGADYDSPIVPARGGEVLEFNGDSCLVSSQWYEIYDTLEQPLGIWPCSETGIRMNVTIAGEKKLQPQNLGINTSDPTKVVISWDDPNNIEENQYLHRKVAGSTTNYSQSQGSGSHEFADTLASTPYKYWMSVENVHQLVFSDTLAIKWPPRTPENIDAEILWGDPNSIPLPKATEENPGYQPTNQIEVTWDPPINQPSGTLSKYIVQSGIEGCGPWSCDTTWTNYEVSLGRTDTVLCLNVLSQYSIRVLALDIYGDSNVVRPVVPVVTGPLNYCPGHIPVCDKPAVPETYELAQNWPNPFNASTVIYFGLPNDGNVLLEVYDVLGRRVRLLIDDDRPAGYHNVTWNGRDDGGAPAASGMYFYRLTTKDFAESKKMVLMK